MPPEPTTRGSVSTAYLSTAGAAARAAEFAASVIPARLLAHN